VLGAQRPLRPLALSAVAVGAENRPRVKAATRPRARNTDQMVGRRLVPAYSACQVDQRSSVAIFTT